MPDVQIKMSIFGEDEVILHFEKVADAAVNLHRPLSLIAKDMMRIEGQVFRSQGRRGGGSWKNLKPDTIKRKKSAIKLIETGSLMRSLSVPGAKYQILDVGTQRIEFGTTRSGAETHQFGSRRQNIPARPYLRFTDYDLQRWKNYVITHLLNTYGPT
jgi:phage gpG-like protein